MAHIRHILRAVAGREGYNVWRTLWLNYRLFPRAIARRLPVKVGYRVDTRGLRRGCIRFAEGTPIHKYMLRLGVTPCPLYSNRSMRTWLWFHAGATLTVGDEVDINSGVRIVITSGATLELGDRFFANQNTLLYCSRHIHFGHDCTLGWDCQVFDSDFHIIKDNANGIARNPVAPVTVGDNVWIANRTTVAKGTTIANGSIVASNSLVTHPLTIENALYAGIPAELKRTDVSYITDHREQSKLQRQFKRTQSPELKIE